MVLYCYNSECMQINYILADASYTVDLDVYLDGKVDNGVFFLCIVHSKQFICHS